LLYILSGPDDFSITQELEGIKKSSGDPSMLATNTTVADAAQLTTNELQIACETVPFLADKRLVILYGLLARFAAKTAIGRATTATRKTENQSAGYETFGNIINRLPESTILVLIDSEVKNTNPLLNMITTKAISKSFPNLKTPELRQWVSQHVSQNGGNISEPAVNLITRIIGSNLWIMSNELEKLMVYGNGQRIEEKNVKELVSYIQQASVFAMVDAIVEFNVQKAETLLQQQLSEGATPTYLLVMLNRQMRLIVRARELKIQKLSGTEIGHRLGITSEFVIRKTVEQSARYTLPRLKQIYQKLLETDLAIKTGKYDGELALNILIAELCQPPENVTGIKQGVAV
jgi:DNA polymerase-3 subunit delta